MVIGIHGTLGSGKDTLCNILMQSFATHISSSRIYRKAHADTLKQIVSLLTGVELKWLYTEEGKNAFCPEFNMTYGQMLQQLGTNVLRSWDPDVWIKSLYAGYDESKILIVPDVRFPNEAQVVRDKKGILIKITGDPVGANANSNRDKNHPSETAMNVWTDWDYVVENDGPLSELWETGERIASEILDNMTETSQ